MWLSLLADAVEVSIRWPGGERWTGQDCRWTSASPGLVGQYATRLDGARLEIPDKLLKPTFPPSPYTAHTPHTPINSPSLPGLVHWTDSKDLSAGVQSRL